MASARFIRSILGLQQMTFKLKRTRAVHCSSSTLSSDVKDKMVEQRFDTRMLEVLACPLSKKPLRYDEKNKELICDELGVAYPILNGIPHLNPQDGRMITDSGSSNAENS